MFQLIIGIIAIALFAAIAAASIFYGGSAFTEGTAKADATTLINGAQQISGAYTLYKANNGNAVPANVAALVSGNYLASAPAVPTGSTALAITSGVVGSTGMSDEICLSIQKSGSGNAALATIPTTLPAGQTYGCWENSSVNTFFFNL